MANDENLTPFKKGDPRAVEGGKKSKRGPSIKSAMKRLIESGEIDVDEIAKGMFQQALEGNGAYAKLVMEYIDGKVVQPIDLDANVNTLSFQEVAEK